MQQLCLHSWRKCLKNGPFRTAAVGDWVAVGDDTDFACPVFVEGLNAMVYAETAFLHPLAPYAGSPGFAGPWISEVN